MKWKLYIVLSIYQYTCHIQIPVELVWLLHRVDWLCYNIEPLQCSLSGGPSRRRCGWKLDGMAQRPIKWCCVTQTEQYVGLLLARCRKISIDFHSYSLGGWGGCCERFVEPQVVNYTHLRTRISMHIYIHRRAETKEAARKCAAFAIITQYRIWVVRAAAVSARSVCLLVVCDVCVVNARLLDNSITQQHCTAYMHILH